ncbi:Organic solute transporter alpha-like protein 1 [Aphelenchoides fujianensis]|nr:Organic solute transporter alpha-like protein 1 [Aphelenchoides fujianensis]KAI6239730.1 Organic solute transporter alpha-like protein 1 [Aphelenchoides fujianensis]
MDFLRDIIGSRSNYTKIPTVQEWFDGMEAQYMIFICLGIGFSIVSIVLAAVHLLYVLRYISNEQIQTDLYWLVFMAPVVSLCGSIGMILPRSIVFLYAVALVYFMLCIFVCVTLMTTLHGSRQAMCEKLLQRNVKISLRVMPLGCCLFCFPKIAPTDRNFRKIEWLVFQSPLVRILLEILNLMVFFELGERTHWFFQASNLLGMLSLFVASYGSYMLIPAGSKLLHAYRFKLMFRIVDFAQLAYSVQKFAFDFFGAVGLFKSGPLLPDTSKGLFYASFLLTAEMLFVSIMASIWFRPSQTIFFDKYKYQLEDRRGADSRSVSGTDTFGMDENGGVVYGRTAYSGPRIEPLALRVEDVEVLDENGNSTKRTTNHSLADEEAAKQRQQEFFYTDTY